jgi:futalosine hydrolase
VVSGIGPAAAAAATATALASGGYELVLSLGVCGAFRGTASLGDAVVATELVAADLGADSPGGFLGTAELGWKDDTVPVDVALRDRLLSLVGEAVAGPVLTVSTVTGTRARADVLAQKHGPVAEAMEGWGVLVAAQLHGLPVGEVRTVSNVVEDRDTATWDFPAALGALSALGPRLVGDQWR